MSGVNGDAGAGIIAQFKIIAINRCRLLIWGKEMRREREGEGAIRDN